jgi:hypothetical protein
MALITKNKNRKSTGAYKRLVGNKQIADLMTAFHAAAICNGNQVSDKLIVSYEGELPIYKGKEVNTPNKTLKVIEKNPNGVIIFGGYISYFDENIKEKKQEVDVIVFVGGIFYCYEIKDGDNLDTKKSKSEIDVIESFMKYFSEKGKKVEVGLISVNMENGKHQIKDKRINDYIISGLDFCDKFQFNFNKFLNLQIDEQPYNESFMIEEMENIIYEYNKKNNKK